VPDTEPLAPGEIARGLAAIRLDIKDLGTKVEARPDWMDVNRIESGLKDRIEAEATIRKLQREAADKAIKALEDWNLWAVRIIVGTILTGILAWIVTAALQTLK
jgi:hypothetical protein